MYFGTIERVPARDAVDGQPMEVWTTTPMGNVICVVMWKEVVEQTAYLRRAAVSCYGHVAILLGHGRKCALCDKRAAVAESMFVGCV